MNIDTNGFDLGDEVTDPITGFKGKIIGFTQWFSGCAIATVQPPLKADDATKVPDTHGFDVTRLRLAAPTTATSQRVTGGPQPRAPERGA